MRPDVPSVRPGAYLLGSELYRVVVINKTRQLEDWEGNLVKPYAEVQRIIERIAKYGVQLDD